MKILAIDSSGLTASCAILEDDTVLAEYTVTYKKTHSETLMPMIEEICAMTETDVALIDAVAVAKGPGSFTGLRIGSATAKGIAGALDRPVIPVPTVDALAMNLAGCEDIVVPLMDARRNETYSGIYTFENGCLKVIREQNAGPVDDVISQINDIGKKTVFLGDGVPVFREQIDEKLKTDHYYAPASHSRQRAACVGVLAAFYYSEGRYESASEHRPEYLRISQAERERMNKDRSNDRL
ncbi:MAG: tRNA (adenosine(37)-N6)-threonylcarbamoyltransferase complex dimerization subunit type 1 TsaB [Lachnospiraceae bacterium]|nr:tRNA (adenosine(37)-N6)-threonylcarbamoyltransferase complex dimerization subunit type 1 TsaB [Lachnospiraceae bacterium]